MKLTKTITSVTIYSILLIGLFTLAILFCKSVGKEPVEIEEVIELPIFTYLDKPITGDDFEFPREFSIGEVRFVYDRGYPPVAIWAMVMDALNFRAPWSEDVLMVYDYDSDYMGAVEQYFEHNYAKLDSGWAGDRDDIYSESVDVYIDPANDARLYILCDGKITIFNKYRFLEAMQAKEKERQELERKQATITNAGLINFETV